MTSWGQWAWRLRYSDAMIDLNIYECPMMKVYDKLGGARKYVKVDLLQGEGLVGSWQRGITLRLGALARAPWLLTSTGCLRR